MDDTIDLRPHVFVTVGTDKFPFDRLMRWVDEYVQTRGDGWAHFFVQCGTSTPPSRVESKPMMAFQEVIDTIKDASVIVCHGGTATTLEAQRFGFIPIVVPRRKRYGEVIDDHQAAFARRLQRTGRVHMADSRQELFSLLDEAINRPTAFRGSASGTGSAETVDRFESYVDSLLPARNRTPAVPVLYIAGAERSGTTLLDRLLGQMPGFLSTGELMFLWARGVGENQLCGCGDAFMDCDFWQRVGRIAYGGWNEIDPARALAIQKAVERHRFIPLALAPSLSPRYAKRLQAFAQLQGQLYRALHTVSEGGIVVDSSKSPSYGYLLRQIPAIRLRVVHMVRDPRGVAYSSIKRVRRPEVVDRNQLMPVYHPAKMSGLWVVENGAFELLAGLGVPSIRVRYEDLVQSPRTELARILRFAGREPQRDDMDVLQGGRARLEPTHTVAGNPMRFRTGWVPLALDDAWKRELDPKTRALVTASTWPLLKLYGYRTRADA